MNQAPDSAPQDASLALVANNVVAGYGDMEILHGVELEVAAGELVAVIGPNGCGKSTMMKVLCGLLRPWRGTIHLGGADVTRDPPRRRLEHGLAYVPQMHGVFTNMTVRENLFMGTRFLDRADTDAEARVLAILPDLADRLKANAGKLSGGQQQMVAIARALMGNPRLLLLDEPSGGLAPKVVEGLFARIRSIVDAGIGVMMVEQNARKALEIADRGLVFSDGEVRLRGSGAELLGSSEVRSIYLGES